MILKTHAKYLTAILLFLFTGNLTIPAQQNTAATSARPKTMLAETEFNFGEVKEGARLTHDFIVKNTGTAPLEIKSVTPACGCTASQFDKLIAPGAEGRITLIFDTTNYQGPLSKYADVTTNDPEKPRFTVTLVLAVKKENAVPGQRVGPFIVSPSDSWKGRLSQGASNTVAFTITNDSAQPVKPGKVISEGGSFTAKLETLEEGKRWMVTVSNGADLPAGLATGTIRVTTDNPEFPELRLQMEATVRAAVTANPKSLDFGVLPIANPEYDVARTGKFVFISQERGAGLEITKVSSTLDFLKLEIVRQEASPTLLLRVMFDKDKLKAGEHSGKITLETNNQFVPKLEVLVKLKAQ